jgi:hypothetical protein
MRAEAHPPLRLPPALSLCLALGLSAHLPAQASWLDSDFYCRVYGCVIIHDGVTFDVYDVYRFSSGLSVAPGQPLERWAGNPFEGTGTVNPVLTGTRTEAFWSAPVREEGVMLGIDNQGNGKIDKQSEISDDGDGVLDAGDTLDAFTLQAKTGIVAVETSAQRSFYLSSRMPFTLAAEASLTNGNGALADPALLSRIALSYDITNRGTDSGMAFGADAEPSAWRKASGVDDLGDIYARRLALGDFTRDIRRRNSATVAAQSVRFDYVYGFAGYDLSMGAGTLSYEIRFTPLRR